MDRWESVSKKWASFMVVSQKKEGNPLRGGKKGLKGKEEIFKKEEKI